MKDGRTTTLRARWSFQEGQPPRWLRRKRDSDALSVAGVGLVRSVPTLRHYGVAPAHTDVGRRAGVFA